MSRAAIIDALERTCHLLDASAETILSPLTPAEIAAKLRATIDAIKRDQPLSRQALAIEFAPTGSVQDIAIRNGWQEEYLSLARLVDEYVKTSHR